MSDSRKVYSIEDIAKLSYGKMPKKALLNTGNYPTFSGYKYQYSYPEKNVNTGDVIVVARGVGGTGDVKLVKEDAYLTNLSIKIDLNTDIVDKKFFYYSFLNKGLRYLDSGSAQSQITIADLSKVELDLPSLSEQKVIAHILGTLDDKIELNRKMNETLEQMAQALFKSWFVDFDPVLDNAIAIGTSIPDALKRKAELRKEVVSSGNYKTLPKEIMELFPSSFEFNDELDKWIPEGWTSTNMYQELESISKTYPLKEVDEVVFLNTGDIQEGSFLHQDYSDPKGLPGQAKKSIQKQDILYSEIRPKNKRFAYVYFESEDYVVSTKLMVLRPKRKIDSLFYYEILKSQNVIDELQFLAESRSGTFPQITFDTLKHIGFVLPNEIEILENYIRSISMYFEKSIVNSKQNESLIKQRDVLLPQLISGKLRVSEEMINVEHKNIVL